jgi:pimeloyl-ACP methyl ester carboxylesterase
MTSLIRIMTLGFIGFVLNACTTTASWYKIDETISWRSEERTGLHANDYLVRQFLDSETLDSETNAGESFYLYFFTSTSKPSIAPPEPPNVDDYKDKTILFIAGGPGEIVRVEQDSHNLRFLDIPGYKVVYFHLRGSGFSQIPEPNIYDRYIRTHYAVRDIELIREKVLGSDNDKEKQPHKWAAVVGYSYGTVLAQQYAHRYPNSLKKLILAGPMSRHQVQSASDISAKKSILDQMREKHRESLQKIYAAEVFRDFFAAIGGDSAVDSLTDSVLEEFDRVYPLVEENFGSLSLLIDSYKEIKESPNTSRSVYNGLFDYSQSFFNAMHKIRFAGWLPTTNGFTDKQREIALIIAAETLQRRGQIAVNAKIGARIEQLLTENVLEFSDKAANQAPLKAKIATDYCAVEGMIRIVNHAKNPGTGPRPAETDLERKQNRFSLFKHLCLARKPDSNPRGGSKRVFYVINHYDGLDLHSVRDLRSLEIPNVNTLAISQEPPLLKKFISKIGIWPLDAPQPWDPAKTHGHAVPTLILSGRADPVSVGGAADHFFDNALLNSEKKLIEIPGLGHDLDIPGFKPSADLKDRLKHVTSCIGDFIPRPRFCLIEAFISGELDHSTWNLFVDEIGDSFDCTIKKVVGNQEPDRKVRIREGRNAISRWTGNCRN